MGYPDKLLTRMLLLSAFLLVGTLASQTDRPDFPTPPPLPDEIMERKPMTPPPGLPDPSELIAQLQQLEELLSLSPEKLGKLRQTIEFIERMSPDEREAMRIRLTQVTRLTSGLRQEIDQLAELVPSLRKSDLSQFWLAASESQRVALRDELESLSPKDKTGLLEDEVTTFVQRREEVFEKMRRKLEEKKRANPNPGP